MYYVHEYYQVPLYKLSITETLFYLFVYIDRKIRLILDETAHSRSTFFSFSKKIALACPNASFDHSLKIFENCCKMFMKPSEIRFSQDSIGYSFGGYMSHPFRRIGQTLDDILSGRCNVDSIPRISVMKRDRLWFIADNSRLWVFQEAEKRGKIEKILRVCDVLHKISIRLRPKIMECPCVLEET